MDNKRNVLITEGMEGCIALIKTNAPNYALENWCREYNKSIEDGKNIYFDNLKKEYYVEVLADSLLDIHIDDIVEEYGYDIVFDLFDYYDYDGSLHNFMENIECSNYEDLCDSVYEYKGNNLMEFYDCED